MIDCANELKKAYSGNAWHGNNLSSIISSVKDDQVFKRPIPNAHTIAELVLHMTAWTEEVISRLMGAEVKEPENGNWPEVTEETAIAWEIILRGFHVANEKLINFTMMMNEDQWKERVDYPSGERISNYELVNGLIQHHAYHGGQISLLLNFNHEEDINNRRNTESG